MYTKMTSELRKGSLVRYNRPGIFQKRASLDVILKEPVKLWKYPFLGKHLAIWVIKVPEAAA